MLERFLKYIREEDLCKGGDRVLLAVSGGMDSMFMYALFSRSPFSFGIAHCNFGLRGEESDEDQMFVKQEAGKSGVPFYTVRFKALDYAREHKLSTQMAARQLRYDWFETLRREEGYQAIAVAHHLNDQVETMLINLVRGTGPAGLHGILPKNGKIIRPLLCFTREEIAAAVNREAIPYREESSNASDKYLRNRLRHQVVPVLKALNPGLEHTFAATARHFLEAEQFIEHHMEPYRALLQKEGESFRISCKALPEPGMGETILYQLIKPFGFAAGQSRDILNACQSQPGKQFFSATHQLIKDRGYLIIIPLQNTSGQGLLQNEALSFEKMFEAEILRAEDAGTSPGAGTAFLDYEKLQLPLTVRYWQDGDRFHPLGMKGSKKLSDFFVDQKIPLHLKGRIPLLLSGKEIAWVAGYRIADPFKVTEGTKKVYRIKFNSRKIN
ncbi:tRNA(Ile)-lysidine synthase [Anseongella ginsenosidimutans]|uniref:tRNA(Ile)-lysidine synthase n=1 Tax=Anseongella ginsenosidimutans TaxID=496056 RepID=A0A4R3L199_9SPHI|nr:tRNA lysidine(34) synthetase TilS [Anseongella ginsenosidimutans]QEC51147.1 tRNA lysidine(34) synthetase TilS [Anseongella ginsenosidimutans]TCS90182.1 tRNA(Ile)-lysidine synthase [Anseongella ginsenosidimutans]